MKSNSITGLVAGLVLSAAASLAYENTSHARVFENQGCTDDAVKSAEAMGASDCFNWGEDSNDVETLQLSYGPRAGNLTCIQTIENVGPLCQLWVNNQYCYGGATSVYVPYGDQGTGCEDQPPL